MKKKQTMTKDSMETTSKHRTKKHHINEIKDTEAIQEVKYYIKNPRPTLKDNDTDAN